VVSKESVDHGAHGDEGEEGGWDAADFIGEVEETDGEAAEDYGEVQPGEECSLISEVNLWLDSDRKSDSLSWSSLE